MLNDGERLDQRLGRMVAMSEAVIAFAITLLAINLIVPTLEADESLGEALLDLGPAAFAWALSFAVIADQWYAHHEVVNDLTGADVPVVIVNFTYLAFITTLPFATEVLGKHGDTSLATALYAANLALLIGCLILLDGVAHVRDLRSSPDSLVGGYRLFVPLVVFVASIPVAFLDPTVAKISWALSAAYRPIETLVDLARRRLARRHRRPSPASDDAPESATTVRHPSGSES